MPREAVKEKNKDNSQDSIQIAISGQICFSGSEQKLLGWAKALYFLALTKSVNPRIKSSIEQ